ncbi:MAG TPA: FG-GAP-like repeat-containing protein [Niastella sp.]
MTTYRYCAYAKALQAFLICVFPFLLTAQTIDLSKPVGTSVGSGSVSGTGGSTYSIPINVLPGTNGMQPDVSLVYNSQGSDGIAGWGWDLTCISVISRAGKNNYYNGIAAPVKYTNSNDAFVLDGQRMFVTSGTNGANGAVYGLENENFSKIESFSGSETLGPDWFKVTTKNGTVLEYGHETNTKMTTDDGASTMLWFLNKVTDINGNFQQYVYDINVTDRTYSLTEIRYTGNATAGITPYNKVVFTYGTRNDWQSSTTWDGGASLRKAYNLVSISVKNAAAQTVRSYDLAYQLIKNQYFLSSVTEKGSNGTGLNPLVFTYGANVGAVDVATSIQYPNMHKGNVYAGDFDGDGKQDVLSSNYYYDNNNIPHYTSYDVLSDFSSYAGQPAISFYYNFAIPQNGATEVKGTSNGYYNFNTFDYDGDSKEDVLLINNIISGSDRIYNGLRINYSRKFSVYSGPTYDSVSYSYIPRSIAYTQDFKYVYRNGSTFGSYFVPGDFDGDGAQDYILVLGINYANAFKGFFSSPKKGIFNQEIALFGVEGTSSDPFYANSIASASQLLPLDFDGDGKQEILVVKSSQSYVLSVFPVSATSGYNYAAQVLYTVTGIKSNYPVFPGDFNGDGKTDLLYRNTVDQPTGSWFLLTSTGKAFNSQAFGFANRPYLPDDNSTSAHHLMVADLNGDGKSDVLHSLDLTTSSSKHTIYYSNGLSFLIESYEQPVSTNGSVDANTVVGDFNGDGKADILGVNNGSAGRFIYPRPFKEQRYLTKVVNGLGAQEGFEYLLTSQSGIYSRSAAYEYDTRGTAIGMGANGNPYNVLSIPTYVVSQSYRSSGINSGLNFTGFQYTDLAYHRIRGFLGFKKVSGTDGATGIQSVTENTIDAAFLIPYALRQYTSLSGEVLSDTKTTNTIKSLSTSYFDKRFTVQALKIVTSNGVTGAATETNNTWDNYGNVTQSVVKTGTVSGETVTPVETTTTTTTFGIHGTPVPAVAENITTTNVRNGQAEAGKTTSYTYNSIGQVTAKTEYGGKTKAVTTTYDIDKFGNVLQVDVASAGLVTRTQKFSYDNTGRLMTQRERLGNGISKKEIFTYEPLFDNPKTKLSSEGLTTTYEYDEFGRLNKTTVPEGYSIMQSFAWETTNGRYSTNATRPGGGRNIKSFYDILGREIKQEVSGYNNSLLTSSKEYNYKGQVINTIEPHYSSETAITTTMLYDNFGRITQTSNGTLTITYGYAKLSGGQYKTTTTNTAGQSTSKTQDAAGRLVAASDNGGSLSYTYNSLGLQTQVVLNNVTVNTATYDEYGNQTGQTDKNAGTYTYEYDAFGQLKSQKNPLGQTASFTYDPFGRIISRTGPEGTTTYEYCQTSSGGYCNNNPIKITGFSGEIKEYGYDNLQRLQTEKVTVDGTSFITQYAYDTYGNRIKVTYPSGIIITRNFDHDGTETAVRLGEGTTATNLFTASAMNSLGKYTAYSYGNGKSSTESYNMVLGTPTQFITAGIQDLSFSFNAQTGNLTSRKDALRNIEEVFTYDNLNRLTSSKVNNVTQLTINYDGAASSSLGNITSKTDAGSYVYNSQKNNAVAYVTNPAGAQVPPAVIAQKQQDITYTAFGKSATVTENNYQLTYAYGSDYQRIKGVLKQNTATLETKYYLGDYEKQTKNGITRELHYIPAGNGLCAIISKEGSAANVYYTYNDYMGSILTVTNTSGTVVASQNFDAWGRYRNPADWTYNNVPAVADWLYRGYTGHEHLREFSLINMNGRMYDPILGRMMSPDNYVSLPFNTQGYNRFGYALNNPLVVADPDGNIIWFIVGAAALFSGISNGVAYAQNGGNFFDGFWRGAIVGGASNLVSQAAGGIGGLGGGILGGMAGGMLSGGLGAALNNGDVGKGILQGGLTGAVSGGLGSYFGGGLGALIGGSAAGALSAAMNGGDFGDIVRGALISGATSFTLYHALNYYNYTRSSLRWSVSYRTFARMAGDYQRSRARNKEFGGIVTDKGYYRAPAKYRHSYGIDVVEEWTSNVKGNPLFFYHTHWDKPGQTILTNADGDLASIEEVLHGQAHIGITTDGPSGDDLITAKQLKLPGVLMDRDHVFQFYNWGILGTSTLNRTFITRNNFIYWPW